MDNNLKNISQNANSLCSNCSGRRGWLERIKQMGGAFSAMMSAFFYLLIIMMFLGIGGIAGQTSRSSGQALYGKGEKKIAVVDINGIIVEESSGTGGFEGSGITTSRSILKTFELIKEDEKIVAVVVRINSPGGSVTASDDVYQIITEFKNTTKIPVIISQGDLAASGGYYVSLAGDTILASATTLTGSVGTIIESINVKTLADKLGIASVVIKSGQNKDMLNPFEEIRATDSAILQKIVDEGQQQFVQLIFQHRSIQKEDMLEIADGRVLSGRQALQYGLVDSLGSFYDAVEMAKKSAGITEAQVVLMHKGGLFESLFGILADKFNFSSQLGLSYLVSTSVFNIPAYLYLGK